MKITLTLLAALAAIPLAYAHDGPVPTEELVAIDFGTNRFYVDVCNVHGDDPAAPPMEPGELVDDCLATGVWYESNNVESLQTKAGSYQSGGRTVVYGSDARLVA